MGFSRLFTVWSHKELNNHLLRGQGVNFSANGLHDDDLEWGHMSMFGQIYYTFNQDCMLRIRMFKVDIGHNLE